MSPLSINFDLMRFLIVFTLICNTLLSQSISDCKKRFETYLNYKGSISGFVKFEKESISIFNAKGQKEFTAYAKEIGLLAEVFEHYSPAEQIKFYKNKGNKKLSKLLRDSIYINIDQPAKSVKRDRDKPLQGIKIAIDAGHLASSFTEAMNEQKYLYFLRDSLKNPLDTVKLFEAELTFKTSMILTQLLEEQGATIFLTRPDITRSTFGCNYSYWFANHKKRVLDSLLSVQKLEAADHKKLMNLPEYNFFWDFFRDFELANRAKLINEFKPDATAIIHYNVDEKNIPWKKTTQANYTMAFIGGCFTESKMETLESKLNFLRLLFTDQLNRSEKLSHYTVDQFHDNLDIPMACTDDADYLKNNCITLKSHGVYSRQLILCNKINSPLVYGECLYQDNVEESKWLMQNNMDCNGTLTNERVYLVAQSYYKALMRFFRK
ncbi:MAG: N-acetylmuramoyl-L-alanine amidase [Sphingobacteriaceae bacterium]